MNTPPPGLPTDGPPEPPTGGGETVREAFFYAAVGYAVSEWGYVERVAAILFAVIVGGDKDGRKMLGAEAAFASVIGLTAKTDMLRAAARVALSEKDFSDVLALLDDIGRLSPVRHILAHGTVRVEKTPRADGDRIHIERLQTAAHDPQFDKPGRRGAAKPVTLRSYNGSQIIDYSRRFRALAIALIDIAERLAPGLVRPEQPPEPEPRPT